MVSWVAFPAALRATSQLERWKLADGSRDLQDEYCEWSVTRNKARKITRVTFTTELPEYWEHLFETAPDQVLRLYRKLVDPAVKPSDLRNPDGSYKPENRWNTSRSGRLVHLIQGSNNLGAAIDLVARATVLRIKNGELVTTSRSSCAARRSATRCATATRRSPRRSTSPPARATRSRSQTRPASTSAGR